MGLETLILAVFLLVGVSSAAPGKPEGFDYHAVLVPGEYDLYWVVQDQEIIFQVQVKTLGYFGLGLSPKGGMAGSDIVTGWVKNDLVYFQVSITWHSNNISFVRKLFFFSFSFIYFFLLTIQRSGLTYKS